jgi:ArsR family transcriptional regulator, arsenate/arsenite/antimonite-responsive transcriptional repressor
MAKQDAGRGARRDRKPRIKVEVTPRFELFYALQALEGGVGEHLHDWRNLIESRLSSRLRTGIARVAPSPLIWPLLADAFRDEPRPVSFSEMLGILKGMNDEAFQRSVLGGVFKSPGSVDGLMSQSTRLRQAVVAESRTQERLLSLLGLHPYVRESAAVEVFSRIVSEPASYRNEVVTVIEDFWNAGFETTWNTIEPQMKHRADSIRETLERGGLELLARELKLPVTQRDDLITSASGSTRVPVSSTIAVHLIPSAFNITRLWAAYAGADRRTRFFVPVLDSSISPLELTDARTPEPALVFKALGDTTRYAIASTIARTPMTSVELSRAFGVSKPTISHHVQQLRAAELLIERPTDNGIELTIDRRVLEEASSAAADEMFSDDGPDQIIRRTRKANRERS